jgi:phage shock protein C
MTPDTAPQPNPYDNSLDGARTWFAAHRLTRPREGRLLGGVIAGFARRYGLNPLVARVAAVVSVLTFVTPLLYIPLWVLMPADEPVAVTA